MTLITCPWNTYTVHVEIADAANTDFGKTSKKTRMKSNHMYSRHNKVKEKHYQKQKKYTHGDMNEWIVDNVTVVSSKQ